MTIDLPALEQRAESYLAPAPDMRRRIFPKASLCTSCRWHRYERCGKSGGGNLEHRRCSLCGTTYKVAGTLI